MPTTTTTSLSTEKSAVNEELDEKQRLAESLKRLEDSFTIPAREYLNSLNGSANKLSSLTGELGPVDANDNDHLRTGNTMDVKDSSTGGKFSYNNNFRDNLTKKIITATLIALPLADVASSNSLLNTCQKWT